MELTTIFNCRKSIRLFTSELISLTKILNAANATPVWLGKYDSIHITVVKNNRVCSNAAIITHNMAHEVVECKVEACYIWSCMIALCQNK